jgi:hypothetical protein
MESRVKQTVFVESSLVTACASMVRCNPVEGQEALLHHPAIWSKGSYPLQGTVF